MSKQSDFPTSQYALVFYFLKLLHVGEKQFAKPLWASLLFTIFSNQPKK